MSSQRKSFFHLRTVSQSSLHCAIWATGWLRCLTHPLDREEREEAAGLIQCDAYNYSLILSTAPQL